METLESAARAFLSRLETLTTEEFFKGGEKAERESLRRELRRIDAREKVVRVLAHTPCEKEHKRGIACPMLPDEYFQDWCVPCSARFALEGQ